jgi:hypothetical protein
MSSPATWIILLGGLAALSFVAMIPLMLLAHQVFNGLVALVIGVPCAVVGVLVARRQPRNPIGWLFLVIAAIGAWAPMALTTRSWAFAPGIIFR